MNWLNLDLVPMTIHSVLPSFILSLLSPIHSATSSIHSFKQQARTGKSEGTLDLWSWESSAKKSYERPDWQLTVLRGCVYRVNRRGPRTEPCEHVCFPSLPPILLWVGGGFESRLGIESSGCSMLHFLKLVARGFLRVLRFPPLLHRFNDLANKIQLK